MFEDNEWFYPADPSTPTPRKDNISGNRSPARGMCISVDGERLCPSPDVHWSSLNSPQASGITSPFVRQKWSFREHEAELLEEDMAVERLRRADHGNHQRVSRFSSLPALLLCGALMLVHVWFAVPFVLLLFLFGNNLLSRHRLNAQPAKIRTPTPIRIAQYS